MERPPNLKVRHEANAVSSLTEKLGRSFRFCKPLMDAQQFPLEMSEIR